MMYAHVLTLLIMVAALAHARFSPKKSPLPVFKRELAHPELMSYDEPDGVAFVHFAFTNTNTEMMTSYYTTDSRDAVYVQWGLTSGSYPNQNKGFTESWKEGNGYNHHAKMINLKPATQYYFRVGDEKGGWSAEHNLTTPSDVPGPFRVGVYGDMGIDNSQNTINQLINRTKHHEYDFAYHIGDVAYPDDHIFTFHKTWNKWFEMMNEVYSKLPYMMMPGNHEYCSFDPVLYPATKDFVVYNQKFKMPYTPGNKNSSMWYSFNYGYVHFVSYSTETSFPDAPYPLFGGETFGDQLAWLKADLAEANKPENRAVRPWIIAAGHRPIYSSNKEHSTNGVPNNNCPYCISEKLQKTFEDIFYENNVDLIINAHVHSYERTWPVYKNKVVTKNLTKTTAPMAIIIGNAGNTEGLEGGSDWGPQPDWSAYRFAEDYGYGSLFVEKDYLFWEFFSAKDNVLRDYFKLQK